MAVSLTLQTRSNVSLSLQSRDTGLTWDQDTSTWDNQAGTWDAPFQPYSLENRSNVTLTLQTR